MIGQWDDAPEPGARSRRLIPMPRKMIEFHDEALTALKDLAAARMATMQELADEAFDDLLRKHGRPVGLKASLNESLQAAEAMDKGRR